MLKVGRFFLDFPVDVGWAVGKAASSFAINFHTGPRARLDRRMFTRTRLCGEKTVRHRKTEHGLDCQNVPENLRQTRLTASNETRQDIEEGKKPKETAPKSVAFPSAAASLLFFPSAATEKDRACAYRRTCVYARAPCKCVCTGEVKQTELQTGKEGLLLRTTGANEQSTARPNSTNV